jgi:hypothetical protein
MLEGVIVNHTNVHFSVQKYLGLWTFTLEVSSGSLVYGDLLIMGMRKLMSWKQR